MKAVVLRQPRQLEWADVPEPQLTAEHDVLIQVEACGICGSDLRYWEGDVGAAHAGPPRSKPAQYYPQTRICRGRGQGELARLRTPARQTPRSAVFSYVRQVRFLLFRQPEPVPEHDSHGSRSRVGRDGLLPGRLRRVLSGLGGSSLPDTRTCPSRRSRHGGRRLRGRARGRAPGQPRRRRSLYWRRSCRAQHRAGREGEGCPNGVRLGTFARRERDSAVLRLHHRNRPGRGCPGRGAGPKPSARGVVCLRHDWQRPNHRGGRRTACRARDVRKRGRSRHAGRLQRCGSRLRENTHQFLQRHLRRRAGGLRSDLFRQSQRPAHDYPSPRAERVRQGIRSPAAFAQGGVQGRAVPAIGLRGTHRNRGRAPACATALNSSIDLMDIYSDIEERLQDLRSRIEQNPALAGELMPVAAFLEIVIASLKQQRHETAWRLRMLEHNQRTLDVHVAAIKNSLIFRFLRNIGKPLLEWNARIEPLLRHFSFHKAASADPKADAQYERWLQHEQTAMEPIPGQGREVHHLSPQPLFSIVVRIQNPVREYLEQAVDSVLQQTYPNWELCVYTADSNPGWVEKYLGDLSIGEPRLRVCRSAGQPGAWERGDYIAFFHQHDVLSPAALHRVTEVLQEGPADLIYSDEDRLNSQGRHVEPVFKPDWSPELLLSCAYIGHLMVLSREAMNRAGGFRDGFTGKHHQ